MDEQSKEQQLVFLNVNVQCILGQSTDIAKKPGPVHQAQLQVTRYKAIDV
jgi:hypothetical protein